MKKIYTIGTSSRIIEEFIEILKRYHIETAVDVRSFPQSKRFPHFNQRKLSGFLERAGIKYVYLGKELGGFKKGGYERYMETETFKEGIKKLEKIGEKSITVFFCCEKLFFRCHRRFISQELTIRGWKIYHIVDRNIYFQT
ncbi:MAG: DUF488 domain-containing protein [Thermodesulfovibrio sp.]|jgi:uncharacterized protein (DUF488 family)|uniref:DUF488 domain-containing protein n=1 Tax=unclassified Thermodesulfovibrio TaxID=2645936 RepID=UPI00083B0A2D|nr:MULTISPECIES: DUF488 domain-containing protein [unclassified Thermodesulfovibrio]MDI1472223.1 DUF488 domain-containing protein [Thermodesulfovibrio sp. 1176]MDI6714085.1 DUF488 domain-containing protein [Thermodesulfovibrio sp.]ODA44602.1 hypothetical protein THER_0645 [Thermodesulfovibrio sp. N1]